MGRRVCLFLFVGASSSAVVWAVCAAAVVCFWSGRCNLSFEPQSFLSHFTKISQNQNYPTDMDTSKIQNSEFRILQDPGAQTLLTTGTLVVSCIV